MPPLKTRDVAAQSRPATPGTAEYFLPRASARVLAEPEAIPEGTSIYLEQLFYSQNANREVVSFHPDGLVVFVNTRISGLLPDMRVYGCQIFMSLVLSNTHLPAQYRLTVEINHDKPNFKGEVSFDLTGPNTESGPFSITLHSHKLIITQALLNESVPLKVAYDRPNQTVTLSTDESIEPKLVKILYMGQLNTIKTFHDKTYGLFKTNYSDSVSGKSNNYVIATHTQPHGARLIFPLVDELTHKVPIELTVITSSSFKVASTAPLKSEEVISMTPNSRFEFEPTPPMASSVFGFVLGDFDVVGESPYRVLATKGDTAPAHYIVDKISQYVAVLEKLLGMDLPVAKLDFVALPFLSDMAMENWGLVTIMASQLLVQPSTQLLQLVAHEIVHQWIGNLVTFDDWQLLWLNESFATWLGDYVMYVAGDYPTYELAQLDFVENLLNNDCFEESSIDAHMKALSVNNDASTHSLFDKHAYEKGIVVLRMLGGVFQHEQGAPSEKTDYTVICKRLGDFLKANKHAAIKAFDIWKFLNDGVSIDVPLFMRLWIALPGYPVVRVTGDSKVELEQHRFIYQGDVAELQLEDTPYHIPLLVKCVGANGTKVLNLVMSDRRMTLDIDREALLAVNHNKFGYYKTIYENQNFSVDKLTQQELISLLHDFGKNLGQKHTASAKDLESFISIVNQFVSPTWQIDYSVLRVALTYIETLNTIFMHFSPYTNFEQWVTLFVDKLSERIPLKLPEGGYSPAQYEVVNSVLQLGYKNDRLYNVAALWYKAFLVSAKNTFIPKEVIPSMLNVTMSRANQKTYKQVLALVKNSDVSNVRVSNVSVAELQTYAVSSLSFCDNQELLHKLLNFVKDNIDSKLIELGLMGFKFKHDIKYKHQLWHWYKVNYDAFTLKSLRKGSDWAKQIGHTMENVTKLVLGEVMQYDPTEVSNFVKDKQSLPEHGLQKLVDDLSAANEENREVASYYAIL